MRAERMAGIVADFPAWMDAITGGLSAYRVGKLIDPQHARSAAWKAQHWRAGDSLPSLASFADLADEFMPGGCYVVDGESLGSLLAAARWARRNGWKG